MDTFPLSAGLTVRLQLSEWSKLGPKSDESDDDVERFMAQLDAADDPMRRLTMRMVGDPLAMDDVLQDAYAKAFRSRSSFRGDSSFTTWLYTIVYRTCLDHRQRRSREEPTEPAVLATHSPVATVAKVAGPETVAERLSVTDAFDALPPDQQASVWLVDVEGYTFGAAAHALGVPVGTIASRVSRGRDTLRALLSADAEQEGR